jgi:hypothetical protein
MQVTHVTQSNISDAANSHWCEHISTSTCFIVTENRIKSQNSFPQARQACYKYSEEIHWETESVILLWFQ